MPTREEIIQKLSEHYDPRSTSWQNKGVLDTLQEEEPCNAADLQKAINENYECDLMSYRQVWDTLSLLVIGGIVKNDPLTKRYSVLSEYKTHEVKYLPVSNYCVVLFTASAVALVFAVHYNYMISQSVLLVTAGSLYLIGQYLGSEFEFNGTYSKLKTILHIQRPR